MAHFGPPLVTKDTLRDIPSSAHNMKLGMSLEADIITGQTLVYSVWKDVTKSSARDGQRRGDAHRTFYWLFSDTLLTLKQINHDSYFLR